MAKIEKENVGKRIKQYTRAEIRKITINRFKERHKLDKQNYAFKLD